MRQLRFRSGFPMRFVAVLGLGAGVRAAFWGAQKAIGEESKTIMKYIALAVLIIAASAHASGTGGTGATGATGGKF